MKWKNLLDYYKKLKRAGKGTGKGADNEESSLSWPYFKSMMFIDDVNSFSSPE